MGVSQTSIIAASLVLAFFVFITVRGELPAYLAVYTGAVAPADPTAGITQANFPITGKNPGVLVGPGGIAIQFPGGLPQVGSY